MKLSHESAKDKRFMSVAAAALVVSSLTGAHAARPDISYSPKVEAIGPSKSELNIILSAIYFKMQNGLRDYVIEPPINASGTIDDAPSKVQIGYDSEVISANVNVKGTAPNQNQVFKALAANPDVNIMNPIAPDDTILDMVLGANNRTENYAFDPRYGFQLRRLENGDWAAQIAYGAGKDQINHQYSTDPAKDAREMTGVIDLLPFDGHIDFVDLLLKQADNVLNKIVQNGPVAESYPAKLQT